MASPDQPPSATQPVRPTSSFYFTSLDMVTCFITFPLAYSRMKLNENMILILGIFLLFLSTLYIMQYKST